MDERHRYNRPSPYQDSRDRERGRPPHLFQASPSSSSSLPRRPRPIAAVRDSRSGPSASAKRPFSSADEDDERNNHESKRQRLGDATGATTSDSAFAPTMIIKKEDSPIIIEYKSPPLTGDDPLRRPSGTILPNPTPTLVKNPCFRCGDANHTMRECPAPVSYCTDCQTEGHQTRNCRPTNWSCVTCGLNDHSTRACTTMDEMMIACVKTVYGKESRSNTTSRAREIIEGWGSEERQTLKGLVKGMLVDARDERVAEERFNTWLSWFQGSNPGVSVATAKLVHEEVKVARKLR